ncbi:hypothetical protein VP01_225g2 [Puccinia sorghi]|uniref:Uncharacterized protein n=1 Tax=Puccinia sorghi TaxID=27349 RepID=A0A0L6V8I0_9BASI|nr:hypothetical protein VP01_225g2 [Puccinia sorghi]
MGSYLIGGLDGDWTFSLNRTEASCLSMRELSGGGVVVIWWKSCRSRMSTHDMFTICTSLHMANMTNQDPGNPQNMWQMSMNQLWHQKGFTQKRPFHSPWGGDFVETLQTLIIISKPNLCYTSLAPCPPLLRAAHLFFLFDSNHHTLNNTQSFKTSFNSCSLSTGLTYCVSLSFFSANFIFFSVIHLISVVVIVFNHYSSPSRSTNNLGIYSKIKKKKKWLPPFIGGFLGPGQCYSVLKHVFMTTPQGGAPNFWVSKKKKKLGFSPLGVLLRFNNVHSGISSKASLSLLCFSRRQRLGNVIYGFFFFFKSSFPISFMFIYLFSCGPSWIFDSVIPRGCSGEGRGPRWGATFRGVEIVLSMSVISSQGPRPSFFFFLLGNESKLMVLTFFFIRKKKKQLLQGHDRPIIRCYDTNRYSCLKMKGQAVMMITSLAGSIRWMTDCIFWSHGHKHGFNAGYFDGSQIRVEATVIIGMRIAHWMSVFPIYNDMGVCLFFSILFSELLPLVWFCFDDISHDELLLKNILCLFSSFLSFKELPKTTKKPSTFLFQQQAAPTGPLSHPVVHLLTNLLPALRHMSLLPASLTMYRNIQRSVSVGFAGTYLNTCFFKKGCWIIHKRLQIPHLSLRGNQRSKDSLLNFPPLLSIQVGGVLFQHCTSSFPIQLANSSNKSSAGIQSDQNSLNNRRPFRSSIQDSSLYGFRSPPTQSTLPKLELHLPALAHPGAHIAAILAYLYIRHSPLAQIFLPQQYCYLFKQINTVIFSNYFPSSPPFTKLSAVGFIKLPIPPTGCNLPPQTVSPKAYTFRKKNLPSCG